MTDPAPSAETPSALDEALVFGEMEADSMRNLVRGDPDAAGPESGLPDFVAARAELAALRRRCEAMQAALTKVADWLDSLAADSERQAKDSRFITLAEACAADARNFKATAKSCRRALSGAAGEGKA